MPYTENNNISKIVSRNYLTDGKWRPLTVALNKSPAWVLPGNDSIVEGSSALLLTDFPWASFMSVRSNLYWEDCEEDAGDLLKGLSLSVLTDNPEGESGLCTISHWIGIQISSRLLSNMAQINQTVNLTPKEEKPNSGFSVKPSRLVLSWNTCCSPFGDWPQWPNCISSFFWH